MRSRVRFTICVLVLLCTLSPGVAGQDIILTLPAPAAPARLTITNPDLAFAAGQRERGVDLRLSVTGSTVTFTRLTFEKRYPDGSESRDSAALDLTVRPGPPVDITRTLELDPFERARALAGSTDGAFDLVVSASGRDATGVEVFTESEPVTVEVTQGLPDPIDGLSVAVALPPDYRYYLHDVIADGEVRITSPSSGTVSGEVVMRGPDGTRVDWSATPSFTVQVTPGTSSFAIPPTFPSIYPDLLSVVPTDRPGSYTVEVEIPANPAAASSRDYEVVATRSPLLDVESLVLIPDVAEARSIQGAADILPGAGYEDYYFGSGSCELYVHALGKGLVGATIDGLVVRYYDGAPDEPVIIAGRVEASTDSAPLASLADGYLRLRSVAFDETERPGASTLAAAAGLYVPGIGFEILELSGVQIGADGMIAGSIDWQADPQWFEAFGFRFGVSALSWSHEPARESYAFGLNGAVEMNRGGTWETVTSFEGLTFHSDGAVDGSITVDRDFALVPDLLTITELTLASREGSLGFGLSASLGSLPEPFDGIRGTEFQVWFDAEGNATGRVVAFNELTPGGGHRLDGEAGDDPTEWPFYVATVDITYAAFTFAFTGGRFQPDHSFITVGSDFYLNLSLGDSGTPADADSSRVTLGELVQDADGTSLDGGIVIGMNGGVDISPPTNLRFGMGINYTLDLEVFKLTIEHIAFLWQADRDPVLGLEVGGGFALDLEEVDFGLSVPHFVIGLDGRIPDFPTVSGFLHIMDVVKVDVSELTYWADTDNPETLAFLEDRTEGSGEAMTPAQGEATVMVTRYLNIEGAAVEVRTSGDDDSEPVMSGGFDRLCFYEDVDGGESFLLNRARVETEGVKLVADFTYTESMIRIGGSIETESFSAAAAGKLGKLPNGKTTMGVFVAVAGLRIPIYAGVFLNEVGGGIFIYPTDDDIAFVRSLARFERPELSEKVTEYRPTGAGDAGSFALMFLGGVYVIEEDLVYGRALVTITANFFSLDAEVEALDGLISGTSYLEISWDPMYADGNSKLEASFAEIFTLDGSTGFYFYGTDAWGISGDMTLTFLGRGVSTASFFLGNPGFLVETEVKIGVDLKVLSGYLKYGGMFWYYRSAGTLGAHAYVEAKGEFLSGLFGAKAGLEAALIYADGIILYGVGSFSVTVCWVEVWDGSLWVAVEGGRLDGGEGRNSKYDDLIDEARNMADAIADERDELMDDLHEAKLALIALNPDQLRAAGTALVERSSEMAPNAEGFWQMIELDLMWDGGNTLPEELEVIYDQVFGPRARSLVQTRNDLIDRIDAITERLGEVEELHALVLERLAEYESALGDPLPSVEELGSLANPFRGYETATVTAPDGKPTTVKTGFVLDEDDMEAAQTRMGAQRESFAEYQEAVIEYAGMIDARLRDLDAVLYGGAANVRALTQAYADEYAERSAYTDDLVAYYGENERYAADAIDTITSTVDRHDVEMENFIHVDWLVDTSVMSPDDRAQLEYLNSVRDDLIEYLLVEGGEEPPAEADVDIGPVTVFTQKGTELWWDIPMSGFEGIVESTWSRRAAAIGNWKELSRSFKENWAEATLRAESLYARKSRLYDILYEVYDQLATYGTGHIAVGSDANAAGFTPVASAGLGFRTAEAQQWVSDQGIRAADELVPAGPSVSLTLDEAGSLDLVPTDPTPIGWISMAAYFSGKRAEIAPYTEIPEITSVQGRVSGVDDLQSRLAASFAASHPIGVVEYSYRLVSQADAETAAYPFARAVAAAPAGVPAGWPALGERSAPTGIHHLAQFSGAVAQDADANVQYHGDFSDLYDISGDEALSPNALPAELPSLILYMPWFSLGSRTTVDEPLFRQFEAYLPAAGFDAAPELRAYPVDPPGEYYLYVRARGAGGKSIVRRAEVGLYYLDTWSPDEPVLSQVESGDTTPPLQPTVTLNVSATARSDLVYAEWGASDAESGIQRYEYALMTYSEPAETGETGVIGGLAPVSHAIGGVIGQWEPDPDVLDWTDAGGRKSANLRGLSLEHGHRYVVLVRATNGVGLTSVGSSEPILVDLTPPRPASIDTFRRTVADGKPNSVRFGLTPGSDPETGVSGHSFCIASEPADDESGWTPDLFPWTPTDANEAIVVDLPMRSGESVYLVVRARNGVALERTTSRRLGVSYQDATPPVAGSMQAWASGADRIEIAWADGSDEQSGVAVYRFAVSTSREPSDDLRWTEVPADHIPYVLGAGASGLPLAGQPGPMDLAAIAGTRLPDAYPAYIVRAVEAVLVASATPGPYGAGYPYRYGVSIPTATRTRTFYAFVRTVNGNGLETTRVSAPITVFGAAPGGAP